MAFCCGLVTAKHCIVEQRCCLDLYSKITFTKFAVVVVFCTVKSNFLNPPNTTVFSASALVLSTVCKQLSHFAALGRFLLVLVYDSLEDDFPGSLNSKIKI